MESAPSLRQGHESGSNMEDGNLQSIIIEVEARNASPSPPCNSVARQPTDTQQFADEHGPLSSTLSPITSPPYWLQSHSRSYSNNSVDSIQKGTITLQDNTLENSFDVCWAKSAYITDFVVINGNRTGIGAFVVWNITVETLHGGSMRVRKRYSEFDDLRQRLLQTFPLSEAAMPPLPPKSVVSKFRPKFLEQRRVGLSYFLNCILLNPEFSGSPVLKDFLFS